MKLHVYVVQTGYYAEYVGVARSLEGAQRVADADSQGSIGRGIRDEWEHDAQQSTWEADGYVIRLEGVEP